MNLVIILHSGMVLIDIVLLSISMSDHLIVDTSPILIPVYKHINSPSFLKSKLLIKYSVSFFCSNLLNTLTFSS